MSTHQLQRYLDRIPDATHFPTAPEIDDRLWRIHAQHPATTSIRVIGTSRAGRPLTMLTVGRGIAGDGRQALVTGTPHPNEPTGALGALALAELLAEDPALVRQLNLLWHFVPCVDPDGAALNYGWYAGPYTRHHYAANIYRPPFPEQYEWTFHRPTIDPPGLAPLPESAAVADVIDAVQPALLLTMHNGEAGGLFAYSTQDLPGLAEGLQETAEAAGLPLYLGLPDGEDDPELGPGLFEMTDASTDGMWSSTHYARPYGTLGLVVEPPMWVDAATADDSLSDQTHRQVHDLAHAATVRLASQMTAWLATVQAHHSLDTARGRALLEQLVRLQHLEASPDLDPDLADQQCTIAYTRSIAEALTIDRLRGAGHLTAFLAEASRRSPLSPEVAQVLAEAASSLASADADSEPTFVGLGQAVRAHVGIALVAAHLLQQSDALVEPSRIPEHHR